jgi:hypothetical protein
MWRAGYTLGLSTGRQAAFRKSFGLSKMIFGHCPQRLGVASKRCKPRKTNAQFGLLPVPLCFCHHAPHRVFVCSGNVRQKPPVPSGSVQFDPSFTDRYLPAGAPLVPPGWP